MKLNKFPKPHEIVPKFSPSKTRINTVSEQERQSDLIANPTASNTKLGLEIEVTKSPEKPVENLLLGFSEFDVVLDLNKWFRGRDSGRH